MGETIDELVNRLKRLTQSEKEQLFAKLLDEPGIREDLLDIALVFEAEAEGSTAVTIDEYIAGKRTYGEG